MVHPVAVFFLIASPSAACTDYGDQGYAFLLADGSTSSGTSKLTTFFYFHEFVHQLFRRKRGKFDR